VLRGPFRFDTAAHAYAVGRVAVPGIHAVLLACGVEPTGARYYTPEARERGKAVHAATLLHDMGETSVRLPDAWAPFFDAYRLFRREAPCRWRRMEHPRVHRRLGYATIIDRWGQVSGRPAVVEIKTGGPAPFHGPQLAGADLLLGPARGLRRRLAVYLRADGSYKLVEYDTAADYHRFLGAVRDYWRGVPDLPRELAWLAQQAFTDDAEVGAWG
jgi:hypothetical protein